MRILVLVSNDLSTDQRVERVCRSLTSQGHHVALFGRQLPHSLPLDKLPYKTHRFQLPFQRGPLFYLSLNLVFLFRLLFKRFDAIHANDLDTLLAAFLISKLRRKHLIYDTHEYFTGVPEIQQRPLVKRIWQSIEKLIFPRLKHVFTVNQSIAQLYAAEYPVQTIQVMRNIPPAMEVEPAPLPDFIPEKAFKIILQGNGINVDRGGEEAVELINHLSNAVLIIAGSGDVIPQLKQRVSALQLENKVFFLPRMPYRQLMGITANCQLGLSLDKDTNINYRYSLPNKVFDYLRAGIPVLATPLVEVKNIVESFQTGWICYDLNPQKMAEQIDQIRSQTEVYQKIKSKLPMASAQLNWENESQPLLECYARLAKA